jgi:hypothetical protein
MNTDSNLFVNEPAGQFVSGSAYPYMVYTGGVADTPRSGGSLVTQFGQWAYAQSPLRYALV